LPARDDSVTSRAATVSIWPIMCKYDVNHVIHKTGSTQRIAAPPEEDRLTAIGNCTKKLTLKFGHVVPEICSRTDLGVTQTQTRSWAYIPLSCRGGAINKSIQV